MIILSNFAGDLLIHFVIIFVIGAYFRSILYLKQPTFIIVSFIAATVVTYINHMYFPNITLRSPSLRK